MEPFPLSFGPSKDLRALSATPLLLLSNGHGEDTIGATLAPRLAARGFAVEAMPIVGDGGPYRRLGLPLLGPTQAMPSGGFIYGRPVALAGDLRHGLIELTLGQIRALQAHRHRFRFVLAVGDIVPLAFAWLSRAPFAFVGCAKSDYYLHGRPGSYLWHERALLRHARCRGVYPRDEVTTRNLARYGISATYLGNPMMDDLTPVGLDLPGAGRTIALLPGSRQEAYSNMAILLRTVAAIARTAPGEPGEPVRFLAAIAPGLALAPLAADGWQLDGQTLRNPENTEVHLIPGAFADVAHAADLALAMAGTATEQVVGLGKPVITIPGPGPQFTASFAEAQTRLLGPSILCLPDDPERVAHMTWGLFADPARLAAIAENGRARMGQAGASDRIAEAIATLAR